MSAIVLDESIRIPGKAASLEAFRRWARSTEFPTRGRYSYLGNELWVDSVNKDTVLLRDLYWQAGVREYWLIDARRGSLSFEILRRTKRGYAAGRSRAGWTHSPVFGKAFKLTMKPDEIGDPEYRLAVR